jgi:hypothetical protein
MPKKHKGKPIKRRAVSKLVLGATLVTPRNIKKLMKMPKDTLLVAHKMSRNDGRSPYNPSNTPILIHKIGAQLAVSAANTNKNEDCGEGVNVATLAWCEDHFRSAKNWDARNRYVNGKLWLVLFTRADIACVPKYTDGKFRLFRGTIIKQVKHPNF